MPCTYEFLGEPKDVAKVRKLLVSSARASAINVNAETQQPSKKRKVEPDIIDVDGINDKATT